MTHRITRLALLVGLLLTGVGTCPADTPATLLTVAERSQFRATSRHADVLRFCEELARQAPVVRLGELGTSFEGRKLPLLILADPPVSTPEEAARSGKLVAYAEGNIHAGEVDGKEGLMMLARELATTPHHPLLKDLVIVFAPIFNADGNERMAKTNRPGQVGPEEGMGVRQNAQGLDLNRDFVKLETPEVRALVRFFTEWQPAIFIDCHTTNGSHHRYTITYEGPRILAGDHRIIEEVRDHLFPDVSRRLEKRDGYLSFFYGNFTHNHTRWETVPAQARYGTLYVGLRNRLSVLSESYSYASYRDRVLASRDFVRAILEYLAAHHDRIRTLLTQARQATLRAGREPRPEDRVVLRQKAVPLDGPVTLLGYAEEPGRGRRAPPGPPRDYQGEYFGRGEPTLTVPRPYAYLFPARYAKAARNLQRHGIRVEELSEDIDLDVEVYRLDQVRRSPQQFQNHQLVTLEATPRQEARRLPAGSMLVRTGQPLGDLVVYLLEPQAADGLATWNFFDEGLAPGSDFPVVRLPRPTPLTGSPAQPLPEERQQKKPITLDMVYGSGPPLNLGGFPAMGLTWLADGEHYLQRKGSRLYKVEALTGRSQPFYDPAKVAQALSRLPTISRSAARALAQNISSGAAPARFARRTPGARLNPSRTGALFEHDDDLYYCNLDGTGAVRLTKTPGKKELASFSPDGKFVAFVRNHNLYVVDLATQAVRALTTDGSDLVFNGQGDWVYTEEVFLRRPEAYWWSPDSSRIAFFRIDDAPVHRFTVLNQIVQRQMVERTPYPLAGDPNPTARLGITPVAGGPIRWVDLHDYSESASILFRAGWTPDSQQVYFYITDRAQTWLDFCTVSREGGVPHRLFRETTKAWVNDPGPPTYLKDGSFLFFSEATGYKHLYHLDRQGGHRRAVTSGAWEVRGLLLVDDKDGWVYFAGTRDSPIALNVYRVRLDGSNLERLSHADGDHQANVSPKGNLFLDTWSTYTTPPQVRLYRADGTLARTVDANPAHALQQYRLGEHEFVHIKTPDGFVLEGSLLKPPDFDPGRHYPVWFTTYGGPHAPTVRNGWSFGLAHDELLANLGFLVFHADPRSASGKGARSTWTAYRRLGIQELADIETAIRWLNGHPWVDASRVGISGVSYGGFMTAFALTHSNLFAAGIAGAPVTDWHNYDTIYTERYMNTPQENPEGYEATSVVKAAAHLHGQLLLVHGIMDDNVHVQNTLQLIQALESAGKENFEVMVYPLSRHGGFGRHYDRLTIEFIQRTLGTPR